jgi:NADPH:quinone reductase-like Zn-dependent oxidoreductase
MRRYVAAPDHGQLSPDEPEASIGMSRMTHAMHGKTVLITGGTGGTGGIGRTAVGS